MLPALKPVWTIPVFNRQNQGISLDQPDLFLMHLTKDE
jgi:hypothetical protein